MSRASAWATRVLMNRVVEYGVGSLRGRPTITLGIDGSEGRKSAHLRPDQARRIAQRLNDLAFHVEQLERES